jgi:N-acetylmuramoyl-L-alanine amidase
MERLGAEFGIQVKVFFRKRAGDYSIEIDTAYAPVNAWGPDAILELHFNASDGAATGTETLVGTTTVAGGKLATAVQAAMVRTLKLADRGVKQIPRGGRGSRSLYAGKAPSVLVEPFFGSNARNCAAAHRLGTEGFARMYLAGVRAWRSEK